MKTIIWLKCLTLWTHHQKSAGMQPTLGGQQSSRQNKKENKVYLQRFQCLCDDHMELTSTFTAMPVNYFQLQTHTKIHLFGSLYGSSLTFKDRRHLWLTVRTWSRFTEGLRTTAPRNMILWLIHSNWLWLMVVKPMWIISLMHVSGILNQGKANDRVDT